MRKSTFIAFIGAALLTFAPASAFAHVHKHHHVKRHHRSRTRLRHITAASSSISTSGTSPSTSSPTVPASDNAGTVTSSDGTKLIITLTDGSTVSGTVTSNTELQCESPASTTDSGSSGSMQSDLSRDGGGDQSGSGQSGSGQTGSDPSGSDPSGNDESGSGDQNDQGDDSAGQQPSCTTANLTPGTAVHEAELSVSSAGSVWKQIDLVLS